MSGETTETVWTQDIDELFKAFAMFREVLLASRGDPSLARAAEQVELEARRIALERFEAFFGARELDSAAHQGYLIRWCLRGLSTLRDEGVLSHQDWLAATRRLAREWKELGKPGADYPFSSRGPAGDAGQAVRQVYLLHQLFLKVDEMAERGDIPRAGRDAALENLRRRVPRCWEPLLPASQEEREGLRHETTLFVRERLNELAGLGKLQQAEAEHFLELFPTHDAPVDSHAEAAADSPEVTPQPPPEAPSEAEESPAQAAGEPLPVQRDTLRDLRDLTRFELESRQSIFLMPSAIGDAIMMSLEEIRERCWQDLIGPRPEAGDGLPDHLGETLGAALSERLEGQRLERALEALQGLGALRGKPPEPETRTDEPASGRPTRRMRPEVMEMAGTAGLAKRTLIGVPAVAVGPDPEQFDPTWVSDVGAFAESEEDRHRQSSPGVSSDRYRVPQVGPSWLQQAAELPVARQIPALMEELSIHWLLFLGAFLVLGGALIWTIGFWKTDDSGLFRYLPLVLTTAFFGGLSSLVGSQLGLGLSARVLAWIVLLLLPLNGLVVGLLGLFQFPSGQLLTLAAAAVLGPIGLVGCQRVLSSVNSNESHPGAITFFARYAALCALIAIWPGGGLPGTLAGAAIALTAAAFLLSPGIRRLLEGERVVSAGGVLFATLTCAAGYLCLAGRISLSGGGDIAAMGLMLLGVMQILTTASTGLWQERDSDRIAGAASTASALKGLSHLSLVASSLLVLSGGLLDNPWLPLGLLYYAYVKARAYSTSKQDRHLMQAFGAGLASQLLLTYGQSGVVEFWSSALTRVLGQGFPVRLLPQLTVGLGCTFAAAAMTVQGRGLLSLLLHVNGAVTTLIVTALAIPYGASGLPISIGVFTIHALLAGTSLHAYMIAIAHGAAAAFLAGALIAVQAPALAWIYSGLFYCWALECAGRSGLDRTVARMNPLLMGSGSIQEARAGFLYLTGVALVPISYMRHAEDWPGTLAYMILAGTLIYQGGGTPVVSLSMLGLVLHGGYVALSASLAGLELLLPQALVSAALSLSGHWLFVRRKPGGLPFLLSGAILGLISAASGVGSGTGCVLLAPALMSLHLLMATWTRQAFHVGAGILQAVTGTAGLLSLVTAYEQSWWAAILLWIYLLEVGQALGMQIWVDRLEGWMVPARMLDRIETLLLGLISPYLAFTAIGLFSSGSMERVALLTLVPIVMLKARHCKSERRALAPFCWLLVVSFLSLAVGGGAPWFGVTVCLIMAAMGFTSRFAYLSALSILAALTATGGLLAHLHASGNMWLLAAVGWAHVLGMSGILGLDAHLRKQHQWILHGVTAGACAEPLAWMSALVCIPRALRASSDPWITVAALLLLAIFFVQRAMRTQSETAAYTSLGGLFMAYVHLKVSHVIPASPLSHILAIAASYPLLVLAPRMSGKMGVYRNPFHHLAIWMPGLTATAGIFIWDEVTIRVVEFGCAGLFYNMAPRTGEDRRFYYLAGLFYNVANFVFWDTQQLGIAMLWTVPAGLTLLTFTHVNKEDIPKGQRETLRLMGSLLISGQSLWHVVAFAEPFHALILGVFAALGVVAALHLRVRAYLAYSTLLLTVDVTAFVVRAIYRLSQAGAGVLVVGGLILIAIAAVFERSRTTLMKKFQELQRHLADWE